MTVMLDSDSQQAKVIALRESLAADVAEKLQANGGGILDNVMLRRWLVARKWEVQHAAKDLTAHAEWRASYVGPRGRIPDADMEHELAQKKAFLQGLDREGRPVCLVYVRNHFPSKDPESIKKFIVYCMDATVREGEKVCGPDWDGKCVGVFDLSSVTLANADIAALRVVFDLLQHHYVERLHAMFLYCAPMAFYGFWKMIAPFVDPVTKKKVHFVSRSEAAVKFPLFFSPEVLPPRLGGTGGCRCFSQVWAELEGASGENAVPVKAALCGVGAAGAGATADPVLS